MFFRLGTKKPHRFDIRGRRIAPLFILLTILYFIHNPWPATAQNLPDNHTSAKPKRILVLCAYGSELPTYQRFIPSFVSILDRSDTSCGDIVVEYLDLML